MIEQLTLPGTSTDKPLDPVAIYTHGSSNPSGGGSWSALIEYGGHRKWLEGTEPDSSAQAMQLTACIRALEALKRPCSITIYTANANLRDAFTRGWTVRWRAHGWSKRPRTTVALWQRLCSLLEPHTVRWTCEFPPPQYLQLRKRIRHPAVSVGSVVNGPQLGFNRAHQGSLFCMDGS